LFIPSPGHAFIDTDYSAVEMATLAQASLSQFGGCSEMAKAINTGADLHCLVASRLTGKPMEQVTKDERQKAKAVNFGLPGGMGIKTFIQSARAGYGIELTEPEAQDLTNAWFDTFPEMRRFIDKSDNLGESIARLLKINCADYSHATGQREILESNKIGILGWMARKIFSESDPTTNAGRRYDESACDYFWECLDTVADMLDDKHRQTIANRTPSKELATAVSNLAGQAGVLTATGRLRTNATYCARHNTIFQGLAADGAKLAMWKLWRNGFRIVNFIHDEFLIEVPRQDDYEEPKGMIERLMIEGMREVVPDVEIKVESGVSNRWEK